MNPIRVVVHGAGGRMGRAVIAALAGQPEFQLTAAIEPPGSGLLGADSGELAGIGRNGVAVSADLPGAVVAVDLVIDFSRPEGLMALLDALESMPVSLVTGTTGLDAGQARRLRAAAQSLAIVQAANFSIGVNLCLKLVELAAQVMGESADVEIIEAHHRDKVDAPSGTALRLGQAVAGALGKDLELHAVKARVGETGPRPAGAIGFATIRAGDIIGEHSVLFAAPGERVEITHKASSRGNFASGAVAAARWVRGREPGLYDMPDVLNL